MHPYRQPSTPPPPPRPIPWRLACYVASVPFAAVFSLSASPLGRLCFFPAFILGLVAELGARRSAVRRALRQARGDFDG